MNAASRLASKSERSGFKPAAFTFGSQATRCVHFWWPGDSLKRKLHVMCLEYYIYRSKWHSICVENVSGELHVIWSGICRTPDTFATQIAENYEKSVWSTTYTAPNDIQFALKTCLESYIYRSKWHAKVNAAGLDSLNPLRSLLVARRLAAFTFGGQAIR